MKHRGRGFDVAVVGAGPAGASAAFHLARDGYRVALLDRCSFPRDKACGDGLTRRSVQLLHDMDLWTELAPQHHIVGTRLVSEVTRRRDIRHERQANGQVAQGLVVRRKELDHLILRRATESGAELWENCTVLGPVLSGSGVQGVRLRRAEREEVVEATVVVAADGANSHFARSTGLANRDPWSRGYAIRGYFSNVARVDDFFSFYLPLYDATGGRKLAGYGWVFPLGGGTVNLGVGLLPSQRQDFGVNLRLVFDRFVASLRASDSCFAAMELDGRIIGAPLACGFDPKRCTGGRVVLAGDAAGLVDPFTGEGIDTALESGKIAATVIGAALTAPSDLDRTLETYGDLLAEQYRDRFRAGRELVRARGFMLKVVESTFDMSHPLFDGLRRAVVGYSVDPSTVTEPDRENLAWLEEDRVANGIALTRRRLLSTIDSEFPLLFKVSSSLTSSVGGLVRMSLAFLSAEFGRSDAELTVQVGATVELACLALAMHANVIDEPSNPPESSGGRRAQGVHAGNMFAVTAGDYLLVKAHEIAAGLGADVTAVVSRAGAEACLGRLQEADRARAVLSEAQYEDILERTSATLFEMGAQLGAGVSGAETPTVGKLARVGKALGMAFRLTEEVLDVASDGTDVLAHPLARSLDDGCYAWPLRSALRSANGGGSEPQMRLRAYSAQADAVERARSVACILDLVRRGPALHETMTLARKWARSADGHIGGLPAVPARDGLVALNRFVIDRVDASRCGDVVL